MPDDRGWQDALNFVDGVAALAERLVAEEARVAIDSAWPVYTAWSAANNRIVEGQSGNFPLDPPTRPTEILALAAEANQNLSSDLEMLNRHTTPGLLAIGNAVPYAADVGFLPNNGQLLYEEGAKAGAAAGIRRVNAEWRSLRK